MLRYSDKLCYILQYRTVVLDVNTMFFDQEHANIFYYNSYTHRVVLMYLYVYLFTITDEDK